eukprot:CAMPEP_0178966968 /NCGR_PEP_ID=MMETSP0789-20121207/17251_1 /TAXON_ID=3005 /ORGANISM="Rhizosolenia setigera, Strain CCMP 1694" /LENGTH=170 /DNA_ID=CAMNT_0020652361 /DNA_START=135 /DNA_END=647 /DNA_ORIENTATION=-
MVNLRKSIKKRFSKKKGKKEDKLAAEPTPEAEEKLEETFIADQTEEESAESVTPGTAAEEESVPEDKDESPIEGETSTAENTDEATPVEEAPVEEKDPVEENRAEDGSEAELENVPIAAEEQPAEPSAPAPEADLQQDVVVIANKGYKMTEVEPEKETPSTGMFCGSFCM